jgi:hypothetical protein
LVFHKGFVSSRSLIAGLIFSLLNLSIISETEAEISTEDLSQYWIGISAFGIQSKNFQGKICNTFLKSVMLSPRPATAVLYNTFGTDNRCLVKFWEKSIKDGKSFVTQFHFSNEAGRRVGNMDAMDFHEELDVEDYNQLLEKMPAWFETEIRDRVAEILALTRGYEDDGSFILSAGLEDNYSILAWQNLYRILSSAWPYQISRNTAFTKAMRRQKWEIEDNLVLEYHGYTRKLQTQKLCIANGDGQDVDFLTNTGLDFRDAKAATKDELMAWLAKSKEKNCITFLWTGKWQGWFNSKEAVPPLQRKFQFHSADLPLLAEILNPL